MPRWSPAELVLHQVPAPLGTIQDLLDRIRVAGNSSWGILITFTTDTVIGSLTMVSHHLPDVAQRWRNLLGEEAFRPDRTVPFLQDVRHDAPAVFVTAERDPDHLPSLLAASSPFTHIADLRDTGNWSKSPLLFPAPISSVPASPFAKVAVLLASDGDRNCVASTLMEELAVAVNATASVAAIQQEATYQDLAAKIAHLEQRNFEHEPLTSFGMSLSYITELLALAVDATGSSVGAVYALGQKNSLDLVTSTDSPLFPEFLPFTTDSKRTSIPVHVQQTGQSLVVNDADKVHISAALTTRYAPITTGTHTLASACSPITLAQSQSPATRIGVLYVEKLSGAPRAYYSAHELALLRNGALRIAAQVNHGRLLSVSTRLASLTDESNAPVDLLAKGSLIRREEVLERLPRGVPMDLVLDTERIEQLLEELLTLTVSQSVTLRLLSYDQRSMVRTVLVPRTRSNDEAPSIPLTTMATSVVAWVGRYGRLVYIPNVDSRSSYSPYPGLRSVLRARPGTKSEVCVPIKIGGRLVGCINLESRYSHAYAAHLALLEAYSSVVGTSLLLNRRRGEAAVSSIVRLEQNTYHRVTGWADQIKNAIETVRLRDDAGALYPAGVNQSRLPEGHDAMAGVAATIDDAARAADMILEEMRSGIGALFDPSVSDVSLLEMATQAVFDEGIDNTVVRINPELANFYFPSAYVAPIGMALSEMSRNAAIHLADMSALLEEEDRSNAAVITIRGRETVLGGERFLNVTVSSPIEVAVDDTLCAQLFKLPLFESDRPHLGASLVGIWLRAIGGDAFVSRPGPGTFATTMSVPLRWGPERRGG